MNIRQIRSLIYCQEYDKALDMLCSIIEKQQKEIDKLKEEKNART